jgi:hypothetical protein
MTREERYRREAEARARVGAGPDCPPGYPPTEPRDEWERKRRIRLAAQEAVFAIPRMSWVMAGDIVEAIAAGDVPRVSFDWD